MFKDVADPALRQGDIFKDVPFPLLTFNELVFQGRLDAEAASSTPLKPVTKAVRNNDWLIGHVPVAFCFCAAISQCCDLELRNGKLSKPAFTLARLIEIPRSIRESQEKFASLRANKDPRSADYGYIHYFYVEPHALLDGQDWIVDYSQTLTVRAEDFPAILSRKVLQMDDRSRVKFKIKLGACFTRIMDEEVSAGIHEPWAEAAVEKV